MCKKNKIAVEKLSADTVANKTKVAFQRMYTVTLLAPVLGNDPASLPKKKDAPFKAGIPYLVWATDINQSTVTIRQVSGGKTATIDKSNLSIALARTPEINGLQYKEKKINGVYHYLRK